MFAFASINLLDVPQSFHNAIDDILVGILITIMSIQMAGSIAVLVRTIFLMIQKRRQIKNTTTQVNPETDNNKDTRIEIVNLDDFKFQVKIKSPSEHSNYIEEVSYIEKEIEDNQIFDLENSSGSEVNNTTKD